MYRQAKQNRSELYAALEPLLNSGRVALLDHPKLLPQLIGLIRKGEKIDHDSSSHDDHANSAAGAIVTMARLSSIPELCWFDFDARQTPKSVAQVQAEHEAEEQKRKEEGAAMIQEILQRDGVYGFFD